MTEGPARRYLHASIASLGQWVMAKLLDYWFPALSLLIGGGIMAYLASASAWIAAYGPIGWGAAAVATMLLLAVVFWFVGVAREKFVLARFAERQARAATVNPLARRFESQRIRLADFYHPFFKLNEGQRFEHCELFGPAHVAIFGSIIRHSGFYDCEAVIVREGIGVKGVVGFRDCAFEHCSFFRTTFYMSKAQYLQMKEAVGEGPPVISDGTAGKL